MSRSEAEVAGFGGIPQVRRALVVPAQALITVAGLVTLASVHLRHRPSTLCPLRALTGVPCPFCGGTTAAVDLGRGQLGEALSASPIAVLMLASLPVARAAGAPRWWHARRSLRWSVLFVVLAASELWQLARLHVVA